MSTVSVIDNQTKAETDKRAALSAKVALMTADQRAARLFELVEDGTYDDKLEEVTMLIAGPDAVLA